MKRLLLHRQSQSLRSDKQSSICWRADCQAEVTDKANYHMQIRHHSLYNLKKKKAIFVKSTAIQNRFSGRMNPVEFQVLWASASRFFRMVKCIFAQFNFSQGFAYYFSLFFHRKMLSAFKIDSLLPFWIQTGLSTLLFFPRKVQLLQGRYRLLCNEMVSLTFFQLFLGGVFAWMNSKAIPQLT